MASQRTKPAKRRRSPRWWLDALSHLAERDEVMADLIERYPRSRLRGNPDPFEVLANSIIGQQISVKAADSIRDRIEQITPLNNHALLSIPAHKLHRCGLSRPKTDYLLSLARWFKANNIDATWFRRQATPHVHQQLLAQRGIGEWTWQMFAIFHLMDSNILPRGDVGLWQAVETAYNVRRTRLQSRINRLEKLWHPYCTAATWFLWTSRDPEEVSY